MYLVHRAEMKRSSSIMSADDVGDRICPDKSSLVALKTVLEVRAGNSVADAYFTFVPVKFADTVLSTLRQMLSGVSSINLQHLRRYVKFVDLPDALKETLLLCGLGQQVTQTPSEHLFLLVGTSSSIDILTLKEALSKVLPSSLYQDPWIGTTAIPLLAPTSQAQATSWTATHWPTVYKKNNPFGPHPHILSRAEDEVSSDLVAWLDTAHKVAASSVAAGIGEPVGAVIVRRDKGVSYAVALAGDARWGLGQNSRGGNVMAHATLRAIGLVAQKMRMLDGEGTFVPDLLLNKLESSIFFDEPLLPDENAIFQNKVLPPNGYLCHNLEIYLTHEPCAMCSMALLHSRFARVVFDKRMPKTGGLCSETESFTESPVKAMLGLGHGLFWRKELNWSLLAWP